MSGPKPSILSELATRKYVGPERKNTKPSVLAELAGYGAGSGIIEDEETEAKRIEAEQKARRDEMLKNVEKGTLLRAVADQGISLGQDIKQVMSGDLSSVGAGIAQGASNLVDLGKYLVTTNPLESIPTVGKSLLIDGIVRPFILTPMHSLFKTETWKSLTPQEQEARYKEMTANFIGAAIGYGTGKLATRASAGTIGRKVLKSTNIDEAIEGMDDVTRAALISELPKNVAMSEVAKGIATVSGWGVPTALLTGDTPEERFANAVNYGAASAAIGGILGGVRYLRGTKARTPVDVIKAKAIEINASRTAEALIKDMPPVEAAFTAEEIAKSLFDGKPEKVIPIIAANVKPGQSYVIDGIGTGFKTLTELKLSDNRSVKVISGKNGKTLVLGDGVPFDGVHAKEFTDSGLFRGALVERGGNQYVVDRIAGVKDPKVKLKRLDGSKVHKLVPLSEVTLSQKNVVAGAIDHVKVGARDFTDLNLTPETLRDVESFIQKFEDIRDKQVKDVSTHAASKSMFVRFKDGKFTVTDAASKSILYETNDIAKLNEFTNSIVGRVGETVLTASETTPFVVAPDLPKLEMRGQGRLEGMIDKFVVRFPSATVPYAYFRSIDNLFRTKMQTAYVRLHDAKRKMLFGKNELLGDLDRIKTEFYAKIKPTPERMTQLYEAIETRSADELLSNDPTLRRAKSRSMTDNEIRLSKNLVELTKTPDELRKTMRIFAAAHDQAINEDGDFKAIFQQLADAESLGDGSRQAAELLAKIRTEGKKIGLDSFSVNLILDLAHSTLGKKKSRADFLKEIAATPEEIKFVYDMASYYDKAADAFVIDPNARMNGYMPRIYAEEPIDLKTQKAPADKRLLAEDPDFQHAMHRLGIHDDYITDPVFASLIYTNRGLRKTFLTDVAQEFRREVEASSEKMITEVDSRLVKDGVYRKFAGELFRRKSEVFLNDFLNVVQPEDLTARAGAEAYARNLGGAEADLGKLGKTILSLTSNAALGWAPIQGLRDFVTFAQIVNTFFGPKTLLKSLRLLNKYDDNLDIEMKRQGFLPSEMNRFIFEDMNADVPGVSKGLVRKVSGAFDKFAELGFEVSMQAHAYRRMHTAMFLERYSTVGEALENFNKSKNIGKLRRDVHLSAYSTPVQNEFSRLVNAGEFKRATIYLAKTTGHELVGIYGYASHPIGWGTKFGRVMGQFGQWPLWAQQVLGQLATRGDVGAVSRWALGMGALTGASMASGVNLANWMVSPLNVGYAGGPVFSTTYSMYQAAFGQDPMAVDYHRRSLARMNPLANPKQIYSPIPFQFWNMLSAVGIYEPNENVAMLLQDNPHLAAAKFLGFSVKQPLLGID